MGRHYHYEPGSFYRVDDRSGFPQRAERTRKEWNGRIVDESLWEPRQPQDLVRGRKDNQTVPQARPLAPAVFVGPLYYTLASTTPVGGYQVNLQSVQSLALGDPIGVVLDADGGAIFRTFPIWITGTLVTLGAALPGQASSGNQFVDYAPGTGINPEPPVLTDSSGNALLDSTGTPLFDTGGPGPVQPILLDADGNPLIDSIGNTLTGSS